MSQYIKTLSLMAASESCNPWLLVAMDTLWYQKSVLSSDPSCSNKSPVEIMCPSLSSSSSDSQPSSNSSFDQPIDYSDDDDDIIGEFSYAIHGSLPTISTIQQIDSEDEDDKKERVEHGGEKDSIKESTPTRPNLVMKRIKPSGTPIRRCIKTRLRLERTLSCKTQAVLEQEEVKGFMDLGFNFNKDRLTPRMVSVVPGLQRLQGEDGDNERDMNDLANEEKEGIQMVGEAKRRPYLSEAWLIKRPDSPLVRLRMPRASTTSIDMKNHLKLWAKTVAYSATQHP